MTTYNVPFHLRMWMFDSPILAVRFGAVALGLWGLAVGFGVTRNHQYPYWFRIAIRTQLQQFSLLKLLQIEWRIL